MPYENEMQNPMNPNRSISDILMDIDKMLLWHKKFNDKSMVMCQATGFNGFKRYHRVAMKCFNKYHIKIENEAFDRFLIELHTECEEYSYASNSLPDHLKNWYQKLEKDMKVLGMLNNEFRMHTGIGNKIIKKALKKMAKLHEKSCRWYRRFEKTNSLHDQHYVDDRLHEKMKAKEERK